MEISITDTKGLLSPELEAHVRERLASLERHLPAADSASAVFDTALRRRPHPTVTARLALSGHAYRLPALRAHAAAPGPREAFDAAFGRLDSEASRLKQEIGEQPEALPAEALAS